MACTTRRRNTHSVQLVPDLMALGTVPFLQCHHHKLLKVFAITTFMHLISHEILPQQRERVKVPGAVFVQPAVCHS